MPEKIPNKIFIGGGICCLVLAILFFYRSGLVSEVHLGIQASKDHESWDLRWRNQSGPVKLHGQDDLLPTSIPGPRDAWAGSMNHRIDMRITLPLGQYVMEVRSYDAHESAPPLLKFKLNETHIGDVRFKKGRGRPAPYRQHDPNLTLRLPLSVDKTSIVLSIINLEGSWVAPAGLRIMSEPRFQIREALKSGLTGSSLFFIALLLAFGALLLMIRGWSGTTWSAKRSSMISIGLICGLSLFFVFSQFRENLIPTAADRARSLVLFTGDEPSYLLIAQAIAAGDGLDVHNVHERGEHYAYWDRSIVGGNQYTWGWYERLGVKPWIDRSEFWKDAQILPRPPLLPTTLAPIVGIGDLKIRWKSVLFISIFASFVATVTFFIMASKDRISFQIIQAILIVLGMSAIPISYYTSQVSPEALVGSLLLIALAFLSSVQKYMKYIGAALLYVSLFGTQRVFLGIAMATVVLFIVSIKQKNRLFATFLVCGWLGYFAYHFALWGSPAIPNTNLSSQMDFRLIGLGTVRFFFSQDVGLFFLSPISVVGLAIGVYLFVLKKEEIDYVWLGLTLGSVLLVACFPDYRAGTCPAGRYQVISAFLFVFPLLRLISVWNSKSIPPMVPSAIVFGGIGVAMSYHVAAHPAFWWRAYHPLFGHAELQPYYSLLPNMTASGWLVDVLVWSAAFAGLITLIEYLRKYVNLSTMRTRIREKVFAAT